MRAVIAGGGTAGHVFPAIALAHRLTSAHGVDVLYLGTDTGLEARLVPEAGIRFHAIDAKPLVRKASLRTIVAPAIAARSVIACGRFVRGADVVIGMGGYVSVPPVLAGARARRPIVLHEQNAIPGLANRFLARFAESVAVSFADARSRLPRSVRSVLTGDPIREQILGVSAHREELAARARTELSLEANRRTVVIFGGSQGALHIDRAVAGAIETLREREDLQLLVLTGPDHLEVVAAAARAPMPLLVRAVGFLDEMELAYAAADLIVARAGATSIAEIAACGLPSILIPYPHATANHQEANARELERAGAAHVILDSDLEPVALALRIVAVIDDARVLRSMGDAARVWSVPDAADALAAVVMEAAGR